MTVYTGWQKDLLSVGGFPDTTANNRFLNDWHANAESDCKLNPVDLHQLVQGHSVNCKPANIPNHPNAHFQSYDGSVWTRTAFGSQMDSGTYPHLHAALKSGNPYGTNYTSDPGLHQVANDLAAWGSHTFANTFITEQSQGGPPPTLKAAQALRGWKDLQRSVNHGMPAALSDSARMRKAALRKLHHMRKVRV